jgi:uncharacterized membrane protein HdeD (DUF308 family)
MDEISGLAAARERTRARLAGLELQTAESMEAARRDAERVGGLLGIAAGIVTFLMPNVTAAALLAVIAAWAIVMGVAEVVAAIELRKVITDEWLLVVAGVASVAFGVFLVARPAAGALAVVLWIGAYALATGVLLVALAFRLRSWGRALSAALPPPLERSAAPVRGAPALTR